MAGTIVELARYTLKGDFRQIDPALAKIILAEAGPRLLAGFPEELSLHAADALRKLGADVRHNCSAGAAISKSDRNGHITAASGSAVSRPIPSRGRGRAATHSFRFPSRGARESHGVRQHSSPPRLEVYSNFVGLHLIFGLQFESLC